MDEISLVNSALKGELDAFNRLVLAYQDMAFNVAYRILGDEDLAADATQNAFLSAYKNLRTFRGGSFKAWVMRMVTNSCYDELRRKQRHPEVPIEPVGNEDTDEADANEWLASDDPSPEKTLEQAEVEHALEHCLDKLAIDFRTVVVLVDVQGMDYEEVSRNLGKPLGTIKSRLARARLHMRDCLKNFEELLPAEYRLKGEVRE
jgi:RNA polymerase sigma-70 factor (ECF subfamily)